MKQNPFYKNEGLESLKGNWPDAVLAVIVWFAIELVFTIPYMIYSFTADPTNLSLTGGLVASYTFMILASILVSGPLTVGLVSSFRKLLVERDNRLVRNEFAIGFSNWKHNCWGYLLVKIYVALWSMLLFIPGVIKALSYSMTFYILNDYPELSANKAIELSMAMMKNRKFDLFYLYLSFAGWILLCMCTLGIGIFWLYPYIQSAQASFYQDVKADYIASRKLGEVASQPSPAVQPQQASAPEAAAPAAPQTPSAPMNELPKKENPEDYMPK